MTLKQQIESERLVLQERLDLAKTQVERNRLGQFATPADLAVDVLIAAKELLPVKDRIRFLDPAIGTGSFYSALQTVFSTRRIESARGFEIDAHYGEPAKTLWAGRGLDIELADFTATKPPEEDSDKANLIICNPPYVRHHHLTQAEKSRLRKATLGASGVTLNGLTGLYCHFLCLSHSWLAENGVSVWLIPSEFMDVNYGAPIKKYLLENVTLERIHRFDSSEAQFGDAIVSSAVVFFRNAPKPPGQVVRFTYGGTLDKPRICRDVVADTLEPERKWTGIPREDRGKTQKSETRLSDLFDIHRGIATGANKFFVISEDMADSLGLPEGALKPILPSPRYLGVDEIEADGKGYPRIDRRLVLLDCNLSEEDVRQGYPELWSYLTEGVAQGVRERYLCRHRKPWYSQESRQPAPFLCTYMARQKSDKTVFRFILNHSKAIAANVYLMLYPKPRLAEAIAGDEVKMQAVWEALSSIDAECLIEIGRVYGGGLYKVEPKELAAAPADAILEAIPEAKPAQATLFPV